MFVNKIQAVMAVNREGEVGFTTDAFAGDFLGDSWVLEAVLRVSAAARDTGAAERLLVARGVRGGI